MFAGTINGRGALEVEVTRLRRDSTLARIIHLVERAQAQRAPSQTFVDRFARVYTPAVLALAVAGRSRAAARCWRRSWSFDWIYRSLVLLVISCPCALVISTPVSIVSALAAAARKGVLIKGGARLERLAAVRCVAFDKTGTLTHGRLAGRRRRAASNGAPPPEVLRAGGVARIALRTSDRPRDRRPRPSSGSRWPAPRRFQALPGPGRRGTWSAPDRVLVGNHRLFEERGLCRADDVDGSLESARGAGAAGHGRARRHGRSA